MPKKLSMLCPTRWRPELAARLAESISATTDGEEVELLFYVDGDDETLKEYLSKLESYPFVLVVRGPAQSVSKSWNVLAARCEGDLLMMGNDDLVAITPGWVAVVQEEVAQYTDGVFVAWVNDEFKRGAHCAFPIVSRLWLQTLRYFTPPYFEFGYNDAWMMEIGRRLDRLHYIDQVVVAHRHFTHPTNPSPRDRTTERARQGGIAKRDRELFDRLYLAREKDVTLLRNLMEVA